MAQNTTNTAQALPPTPPTTTPPPAVANANALMTPPPTPVGIGAIPAAGILYERSPNVLAQDAVAERRTQLAGLKSLSESTGYHLQVQEKITLQCTPLSSGVGREAAVHERTRPEEMTKRRTAVWSAIGSCLSPYATHHRLRVVDLVPDLAGAISAERDPEQRSKCSGVYALRVAEQHAHHVIRALSNDFSVTLPYRHGDEYDHIACPADMIHGKVVAGIHEKIGQHALVMRDPTKPDERRYVFWAVRQEAPLDAAQLATLWHSPWADAQPGGQRGRHGPSHGLRARAHRRAARRARRGRSGRDRTARGADGGGACGTRGTLPAPHLWQPHPQPRQPRAAGDARGGRQAAQARHGPRDGAGHGGVRAGGARARGGGAGTRGGRRGGGARA